MGCCESSRMTHKNQFAGQIIEGIQTDNPDKILSGITRMKKNKARDIIYYLEESVIEVPEYKLNCLSYSIYLGKAHSYNFFKNIGCKLHQSELEFSQQGSTLLTILCQNGYSDILKDYLPKYLAKTKEERLEILPLDYFKILTPIHTAVKEGHIHILSIIHDHIKSLQDVPEELSFAATNQEGENAALLACRFGSFLSIKFIHSKYPHLFYKKNKQDHNAIHITFCGCIQKSAHSVIQIVEFLVNTVGLDLKENYLKTLLTIQNQDLRDWVELKLNDSNTDSFTFDTLHTRDVPTESSLMISFLNKESIITN